VGVASEQPAEVAEETGFGPGPGASADFGLVNLTQASSQERGAPRSLKVRFGAVRIEGGLDPDVTMRILRQGYGALRQCYEALLRRRPTAHGTVEVSLELEASGAVARAKVGEGELTDPGMKSCLVKATLPLGFPQPTRVPARVTVPLEFAQ